MLAATFAHQHTFPYKILKYFFFQNRRVVSLSCSPTGAAFVCSASTSKKSNQVALPLRLNQSKGRQSDASSTVPNGNASSVGILQCWDMKSMKFDVSSLSYGLYRTGYV
jgi:hypothetical protein